MNYDPYDPRQLYTFPGSPKEELQSRKDGRSTSSKKMFTNVMSYKAPKMLRTEGDYFPRALPLHGTRNMTYMEHIGLVLCSVFFALVLYQLLLGAGYVHGACDLPLTEGDRFKEVFLWPLPLSSGCRYS